jgi:hypothetical protein
MSTEKLTPRFRAIVNDCLDDLIKEAKEGRCKRGNIFEKVKDEIMTSPTKFMADVERREQGAGAPPSPAAGGALTLDIRNLFLQAAQSRSSGDTAKVIEGSATPGTSRVQPPLTDWDH